MMNIDTIIDDICNRKIQGKRINEHPLCILIGGLPGAGKTNLIEKVKMEHKGRDFVVIDADDYRKLHPNYEDLIKTPEKAVTETISFARGEKFFILNSENYTCLYIIGRKGCFLH